jgi:hypothetical protein
MVSRTQNQHKVISDMVKMAKVSTEWMDYPEDLDSQVEVFTEKYVQKLESLAKEN